MRNLPHRPTPKRPRPDQSREPEEAIDTSGPEERAACARERQEHYMSGAYRLMMDGGTGSASEFIEAADVCARIAEHYEGNLRETRHQPKGEWMTLEAKSDGTYIP